MEKLDNVIDALECCRDQSTDCSTCPYNGSDLRCFGYLVADTVKLLKDLRDDNQRLKRQLGYVRAERDVATSLNAKFIRAHMDEEVADGT